MDYALAIRRNRDQLREIILALLVLAGLSSPPHRWDAEGGRCLGFTQAWSQALRVGTIFPPFLTRRVIALIMLVLRPAESALRRLIVIAAQGLKPTAAAGQKPGAWPDLPPRGGAEGRARPVARPGRGHAGHKAFALFDPLKSFDPDTVWDAEPVWQSGFELPNAAFDNPNATLDATRLGKRLAALIRALDDIPHQARRLLRHNARRDAKLQSGLPARLSPIRPGLPPGWRARRIHDIDDVLKECHRLAIDRLNGG